MRKSELLLLNDKENISKTKGDNYEDHLAQNFVDVSSPPNETSVAFMRLLLKQLRKPLNEQIKQRVGWVDRSGREHKVDYVEWHTVADLLDQVAPNWSYKITDMRQIGDFISVTAAITINGVTREGIGTGTANSEMGIKKAESDALKRAARMFGVARDLYKDSDEDLTITRPQTNKMDHQPANSSSQNRPQPPKPQPTRNANGFPTVPLAQNTEDLVTAKQLAALRTIASAMGLEAEAECQRLLNCDLKEISRRAASALIDHFRASPQKRN